MLYKSYIWQLTFTSIRISLLWRFSAYFRFLQIVLIFTWNPICIIGWKSKFSEIRTEVLSTFRKQPTLTYFVYNFRIILENFCLKYVNQLYSVPSRVWTVPPLCSWKFWKIRKDFDVDEQLDSIAPEARAIESNCPSGSKSIRIF